MLRNLFGYKHSVYDVYPLRKKRVFLLVDPQNILGDTSDSHATFSTIEYLLKKEASVILASSFGPLSGVTLNLTKRELRVALDAFKNEEGMGYTNFFASLSPALKLKIIRAVVDPERIAAADPNGRSELQTGKTQLFAGLPIEKKLKAKEMFFPTKEFAPSSTMPFVHALKAWFPKVNVRFSPDCLRLPQEKSWAGEILVLENLRFYKNETSEESKERASMAEALAANVDIYINDSFASAHALLASTTELPHLLKHGAAGLSMYRELSFYAKFLNRLEYPLAVVVGGTDISLKLQLIYRLASRVDRILVSGTIALPFLAAKGLHCGVDYPLKNEPTVSVPPNGQGTGQKCRDAHVGNGAGQHRKNTEASRIPCSEFAKKIMELCAVKQVELVLPIDHVVGDHSKAGKTISVESAAVPPGMSVLDCGMNTINLFIRNLRVCRTVLWTGPLGRTSEGYITGTATFATELRKSEISSIVAGDETLQVIRRIGIASKMMHLSSGGVSSLCVVEGDILPGVESLSDIAGTASDPAVPGANTLPLSAMLCNLPPFSGCDSHNLQLIAKKFIRRTYESGDYLVFSRDRHMCMYLVAQGGLVAQFDDEYSSAPARYIGKGQTVGMYEFFTQAPAFETVRVAQPDTVVYQLLSSSLNELLNSNQDLAVLLLKNISEPLYQIVSTDHRDQQGVGKTLLRNACRTRVPQLLSVPERPSLMGDLLCDVVAAFSLRRLSLSYMPFVKANLDNAACNSGVSVLGPFAKILKKMQCDDGFAFVLAITLLRDVAYHQFLGLFKQPWIATTLAAVLTSPLSILSYGIKYHEVSFKILLNGALISGAVSVAPMLAYGLALELRRRLEHYRKKRLGLPAQVALMALVKLVLGFVVFPIVYQRNFIHTDISTCGFGDKKSFVAYEQKQVASLLLRYIIRRSLK